MAVILWFSAFGFVLLIGLTLVAEAISYREEQQF